MPETQARSGLTWLKYGCFGCAGVVVLGVVAAAIVVGLASMQVRSEQAEDRTLIHDATAVSAASAVPPGDAPSNRVRIRVASGGFEVVPAKPGEPLRVEARYDATSYRLDERLEEREDGWDYELDFDRTGGGLMTLLKQMMGGTSSFLTIHLPMDSRLDLDFEAYQAGGTVELGGLWLRNARVRASQGGLEFAVSDPLQAPMDEMTIEASMGGLAATRLGNASPRKLDVDCGMGGVALDLRGKWLADSDISIGVSRGEVNLQLPRDVQVVGLAEADLGAALREDELPAPTLRFSTSTGKSGEITVSGRRVDTD